MSTQYRLRPAGERGILIDLGSLDTVHDLTRVINRLRAEDAQWSAIEDLVPAASTLLVTTPTAAAMRDLFPRLEALVRAAHFRTELGVGQAKRQAVEQVIIPVNYHGEDLADVARLTGLTEAEVVAAHTGRPWRVAFGGFAPGFAYLIDGDPRLEVPRRQEPRTAVPSGAVALAGAFSGVYPRQSPGGWQLIGSTDLPMWDADREPPALLQPGTLVQFMDAEKGFA